MKVKVIKRYNDMLLRKVQEPGTVFETDDARGKYLIGQGMVEEVPEKKNRKAGDPDISQQVEG